jgi:hypothetical protein
MRVSYHQTRGWWLQQLVTAELRSSHIMTPPSSVRTQEISSRHPYYAHVRVWLGPEWIEGGDAMEHEPTGLPQK